MKPKYTHFRGLGRELAMQFLFQFDLTEEEFNDTDLVRFFQQIDVSEKFPDSKETRKAKKYATKLIEGIVQNLPAVDDIIQKYIAKNWTWERIAPVDRGILRVATFEMLFIDNVPPIVAINEAVDLAKNYGSSDSKAFVNALLNSIKNNLKRDPRIAK